MKNPVIQAQADIEWCMIQIGVAKGGGNVAPYSPEEWIACMHRRIAANERIIEDHTAPAPVKRKKKAKP